MDILDQSEVDALLSSASAGSGIAEEAPGTAFGEAAPAAPTRNVNLPPELRLQANQVGISRIAAVKVPVIVRLAECRLNVNKILELTVGAIIEFDKASDSDLDLVVSNMPVGTGNAVKCGENFGLRVIRIEPWIQRIIAQGLYR